MNQAAFRLRAWAPGALTLLVALAGAHPLLAQAETLEGRIPATLVPDNLPDENDVVGALILELPMGMAKSSATGKFWLGAFHFIEGKEYCLATTQSADKEVSPKEKADDLAKAMMDLAGLPPTSEVTLILILSRQSPKKSPMAPSRFTSVMKPAKAQELLNAYQKSGLQFSVPDRTKRILQFSPHLLGGKAD